MIGIHTGTNTAEVINRQSYWNPAYEEFICESVSADRFTIAQIMRLVSIPGADDPAVAANPNAMQKALRTGQSMRSPKDGVAIAFPATIVTLAQATSDGDVNTTGNDTLRRHRQLLSAGDMEPDANTVAALSIVIREER